MYALLNRQPKCNIFILDTKTLKGRDILLKNTTKLAETIADMSSIIGFLVGSTGKESACQCKRCRQETWVQSLDWEDLLEEEMATHSSCLGNSTDEGAWWVTVHGAAKSQTWLSRHICNKKQTQAQSKGEQACQTVLDTNMGVCVCMHVHSVIANSLWCHRL